MQPLTLIGVILILLNISSRSTEAHRHHRQVPTGTQAGVCRYGRRLECCYGWVKNNKGQCEAQCEHGCKHGDCVGPNKCKCFPGFTGKTCNQDLNECGLKPRPCEHRCMNTHGSYKCYCLNGYMLMYDGSCANSRTCSIAHCQYGCEEVDGEIRCLCPSAGLQLGQDERTCVDIDECITGKNLCPYNRQCVNTFGSYYCKCQDGYDLKYVNSKYDCIDIDECADETHKCSQHAVCLNTLGSYRCRCKPGFRGNGFECSAIPESQLRPEILGGKFSNEDIKNAIPETVATPSPKIRHQPFDYDGEVHVGTTTEERQEEYPEEEEEEEEEKEEKSKLNSRGDVFRAENGKGSQEMSKEGILLEPLVSEDFESVFGPTSEVKDIHFEPPHEEDFESVFGPSTEVKEIHTKPPQEEYFMECNFDHGACEWVQDNKDDIDWTVAYHYKGGEYYMALSGLLCGREDVARLKLLLSDREQHDSFCLTFDYRVTGHDVGSLRVMLDNNAYAVWEQRKSKNQSWQTEFLTVAWKEEVPQSIIFEAQCGNGIEGEIGLDNVVLTSGPCEEDVGPVMESWA